MEKESEATMLTELAEIDKYTEIKGSEVEDKDNFEGPPSSPGYKYYTSDL